MERNGLGDRSREIKVSYWVLGFAGFFLIGFFLAPLSVEKGAVPKLSGRANAIDYYSEDSWGNVQDDVGDVGHDQSKHGTFAWSNLNPYAAFIYAFGDLNCHNKYERSWKINDNQMPVCTRDVGIFLGLVVGAAIFRQRGLNRWTMRDSFLSIFPDKMLESTYRKNRRTLAFLGVIALGVIPLAIDGFTQLLTDYESNNVLRVVTGIPFGAVLSLWFCSSLSARPGKFESAGQVRLPSGASFRRVEEE